MRRVPRPVLFGAAGIVVVVLLALASLARSGHDRTTAAPTARATPTGSATPTWIGPTPPGVDAGLIRGRPSAPVMIVEFGDYQCPKCGEFARDIEPRLIRRYVDTGVARIAWRDFPFYGKESVRAAVAARAAGQQGEYWRFHDALYARQFPVRSGHLTDAYLRGVARRAGLDLRRYDAAVAGRGTRAKVDGDYQFGQGLGVPGTPAFLINGEPFFGAQPMSAFVKAIEQARKEA
jgi:protein-disulfide isomerase